MCVASLSFTRARKTVGSGTLVPHISQSRNVYRGDPEATRAHSIHCSIGVPVRSISDFPFRPPRRPYFPSPSLRQGELRGGSEATVCSQPRASALPPMALPNAEGGADEEERALGAGPDAVRVTQATSVRQGTARAMPAPAHTAHVSRALLRAVHVPETPGDEGIGRLGCATHAGAAACARQDSSPRPSLLLKPLLLGARPRSSGAHHTHGRKLPHTWACNHAWARGGAGGAVSASGLRRMERHQGCLAALPGWLRFD